MPPGGKNFTQEFALQRKKFRPWAILILLTVLALGVVLPLLFSVLTFSPTFFKTYITIGSVVLLFAIPSAIKYSKCPNCKKFMGRTISKFCPTCGAQIQNL